MPVADLAALLQMQGELRLQGFVSGLAAAARRCAALPLDAARLACLPLCVVASRVVLSLVAVRDAARAAHERISAAAAAEAAAEAAAALAVAPEAEEEAAATEMRRQRLLVRLSRADES